MIGIVVRFDLIDSQAVAEFDRLTDDVVAQIGQYEPGTLVYATHHVVGEPLARIFYELYADEDALAAHENAPHVLRYHAEKATLLARDPRVEHVLPGPSVELWRGGT